MLLNIARFERRYQMRNPIFWIALALLAALVFAGTLGSNSFGPGPTVHKNSPYKVAQVYLLLSVLYLFVTTAFVANAVVRDDETGFGPILHATPISAPQYLLGRYIGAFLAAATGFLIIPAALWIGTQMPGVEPSLLGPSRLSAYLGPLFCLALPNLFVTSALLFALATMTRSMIATYVSVVALLILWFIGTDAAFEGHGLLAAYGDPFGFNTVAYMTRYWSLDELNTRGTPMYGVLLTNRLLWMAIGAASLALATARFRFRTPPTRARRRAEAKTQFRETIAIAAPRLPISRPRFDRATAWAQLRARTWLDMAQVFRSPAYAVLLALGIVSSLMGLRGLHPMWGTPTLPVTRLMVELLQEQFKQIPLVIAIYYSSELVWRERDRNIHEIIGASAVPDWAYVLPKTLALALVLISTLLVGVLAAVSVQFVHGHTDLEVGRYLLWYLLPNAVDYVLIAILAIFVQVISPHKYIGWGIMLLFVVARAALPQFDLNDHLYTYAQGPSVPLSDMNGQGRFWIGAWSFRAYWAAFALFLLVLSHALWRRGADTRLRARLKRLPHRLNGAAGRIAAVAILAFIGLGSWCFVNTHIWNRYRTARDDRYLSTYEQQLLPYEKALQPSVTMVHVQADLWPRQHRLVARGTLDLVNRQAVPLAEVHVRMRSWDTQWTALTVSGATLARDYPDFQYRIYRFAKPLAPGAVAHIVFATVRNQIGFRNEDNDVRVVDNGTFVDNLELLPTIGMDRLGLLQDPIKRRTYGLPPELHSAALEDVSATRYNRIHGDWVKTDIILTTDADQTPIAPGARILDVVAHGRRTARFVSEAPIQNYFSIQSARYRERHHRQAGVDLAVYYDVHHAQNVDRMLSAAAEALNTYRAAFGPYPFREARIVEFPAYGTFAQSFAGTFPYSEGIGFIADLSREENNIEYVSQLVAHELAHQYWGHQATPADMQGAMMLDETLAQYSALIMMERTRGPDQVRRYLQHELDTYLAARGTQTQDELPLARVESQPTIAYQKGALAMYRLKTVLGEERVNAALRRYLDRFRFRSAPYPRSIDLIAEFRSGASPVENQLITDLFEAITLYDIKVKAARVRTLPDGRYETTLTIDAHKYYADGKGKEREAPLDEPIGFALYAVMPGGGPLAATDVLVRQAVATHSGVQQIRLVSASKPSFAGSDPYDVLIDRRSDDNVVAITR